MYIVEIRPKVYGAEYHIAVPDISALKNVMSLLEDSNMVLEYKISYGANSLLTGNDVGYFPCPKLVTKFNWSKE